MAEPARRAEFLLELGCEEIPASWLRDLTEQLRARFEETAGRELIEPAEVAACSTPRRLVLRADVRLQQSDREELIWGPSLKVARDAAGRWTPAAEGFARKNGVAVGQLQQRPKDLAKPDELNLLFVKRTAGRPALEVLPGVIAATLRALAFPKRMSWDAWLDDGKGAFPFGRPIRWLVALLAGKVVPLTIYELVRGEKGPAIVTSGDKTYGHRFLPRGKNAGQPVRVSGFEDLQAKLRGQSVILDAGEREAEIERQLQAHCVAANVRDDHGLRGEWPQLVEFPTVVVGRVPEEFQSLPVEVLETVLVHHQKYIPLFEAERVARFAAVTNTDEQASAEIVRGMERVVVARLRDAAFFFAEDRKRHLSDRVDELAGVTFHQKLGSYRDKAVRLVELVDATREDGALSETQHPLAQKAALLCKADLTTLMVREFTELQGVIGGIYLAAEEVEPAIARAVYWHYHPIAIREHDAPVHENLDAVFGAVSLADKLDTLAGYFLIGLEPKGGSDPFGLRRAAQGAVRVLLDLWEGQPRPGLRRLLEAAVAGYPQSIPGDRARASAALGRFLLARLEYVLEARGFARDEVAAATGAPLADALDDPHDALERVRALHRVREEMPEVFNDLAESHERATNILRGQEPAETLDPGLFESPAERELHAAILEAAENRTDGYEARLRSLAALRDPIHRFFDRETGVLVMHEDARIRGNRLSLLTQARRLFDPIADISKLGGS